MSFDSHFPPEVIDHAVTLIKSMKDALPHLQHETFWLYEFCSKGKLAGFIAASQPFSPAAQ
jgi:hypothetical protein